MLSEVSALHQKFGRDGSTGFERGKRGCEFLGAPILLDWSRQISGENRDIGGWRVDPFQSRFKSNYHGICSRRLRKRIDTVVTEVEQRNGYRPESTIRRLHIFCLVQRRVGCREPILQHCLMRT